MMKKIAKSEKKVIAITVVPIVKPGSRKNSRGRSGSAVAFSQYRNDTSATTPTMRDPATSSSLQPRTGASMIPNRSAARATTERKVPRGSRRGRFDSRLPGTHATAPANVKATTGRFIA